MKINILPFSKVITDITKNFTKVKKQNYLSDGNYAIVDQGKFFICGYTNKEEFINFDDIPIIIFGDHTKVLKYIDFPIAIGADGVKVLTVDTEIADTKYIYYFLKSLNLHDAGYSRHFKYLKAKKINLPELIDDQIKIANLLTQVESLIDKREESIQLLDELLKSTFLDMFGDPVLNEKGWDTKLLEEIVTDDCSITYGIVQPGEEYIDGVPIVRPVDLSFDPIKIETLKRIDPKISKKFDRTLLNGDELLLTVRGTVGDIGLATNELKGVNVTRGITPLRFFNDMEKTFYYYQLKSKPMQNKIETYVKGAALRQINLRDLRRLKLIAPNSNDDNILEGFVKKANQIESMKLAYEDSLDQLKELFSSLSQRAFRGELDFSKMTYVSVADTAALDAPSSSGAQDIVIERHKVETIKGPAKSGTGEFLEKYSTEERLKSRENDFRNKMDEIMDKSNSKELSIEDEGSAVALTLGYQFGFEDDESIDIIEKYLKSVDFLEIDKAHQKLINEITEKHPMPAIFKSTVQEDQSKEDVVAILKEVVEKHSNPDILISKLLNLIGEKKQNMLVRQEAAVLLSNSQSLTDDILDIIVKIIDGENGVEQEIRLILAYVFTDKVDQYPKLYKSIYSTLREPSTSPLSNKEVFIHFLESQIKEKKKLAFDTLVKNIADHSSRSTAYKMLWFKLMNKESEMIETYDYEKLKKDIFSLLEKGNIQQDFDEDENKIILSRTT